VAVQNVVAQHHHARLTFCQKVHLPGNSERERQTARFLLRHNSDPHPEVSAVAQQMLEPRHVARVRNDQQLLHTGHHQQANGIENHRLVVHR
jgi:hypothetical protein